MFVKHATFEVLEAKVAHRGDRLMRSAHKASFDYDPRPGYLYVRSRAISSRTNDNYDNFPADEIEKGYLSFVGKPVFVNHHNDDHRRARGVIIDAALHRDQNPGGEPDTWVEVLMEVDAIKFPKLAEAILKGEIERTSMGTDVEYSLCSVCSNKASTPMEYCKHIPKMKGMKVERVTASGDKESVLVYEKCYGLSFFENSLLVEEPADPTAYFLGVDDRGLAMAASKTAELDYSKARLFATYSEAEAYIKENLGSGQIGDFSRLPGQGGQDGYYVTTGNMVNGLVMAAGRQPNVGLVTTERGFADMQAIAARHARPWKKTASRKQGYGETVAPTKVDTLRDEFCPVCGEQDSFDGDSCKVCQYIRPPEEFLDPDLEKARDIDLRQEEQAEALDENGQPIDGEMDEAFGDESEIETDAGEVVEVHPHNPDADAETDDDESEMEAEVEVSDEDDSVEVEVEVEDEDGGDDAEDDDEDDKDGEDDDVPPFLKKKKKSRLTSGRERTGGTLTMSAALKILARQEREIRQLRQALAFVAKLAGVEKHPKVAALVKRAEDENPANSGWAMDTPPPEEPYVTTEEALGEVDADAEEGGNMPDSVEELGETSEADVSADAQTDVGSTETVLDEPLDLNEQDVERPVAGTEDLDEGPRGEEGSGRTETEVRVGDPNDPQPAFDMADGGWVAKKEGRFIAALRLARLQIAAGLERGEDLVLANSIAHGDMTDNAIQHDIDMLSKVIQANKKTRRSTVPRNLVPTKVQGQRTVPSLRSEPEIPIQSVASGPSSDEFLFE